MQIELKREGFSFFKVISSFIFLLSTLIFPLFGLVSVFTIFFAKVHSLGAWIAMWRAKKLTWFYFSYIAFLIVFLSYVGMNVLSLHALGLLAFTLFAFHFVYDEYELGEEKRTHQNIILMLGPLAILYLIIARDFLLMHIVPSVFIFVVLTALALEAIYVRKINWIFISSKILLLFMTIAVFQGRDAFFIFYTLLMYHYLFWFAYPVYKLNKYVKDERDDFIMIIIIIILMSGFIYSTKIWGGADAPNEILQRTFYIASIAHVLSTAPFAYLFGLKRKAYDKR